MIKLTVSVFGGEQPPVPITIYIDGKDYHKNFKQGNSFSTDLNLSSGDYHIMVGGLNPSGGSTKVELDGVFKHGPHPGNVQSADSKQYALIFFFTV